MAIASISPPSDLIGALALNGLHGFMSKVLSRRCRRRRRGDRADGRERQRRELNALYDDFDCCESSIYCCMAIWTGIHRQGTYVYPSMGLFNV